MYLILSATRSRKSGTSAPRRYDTMNEEPDHMHIKPVQPLSFTLERSFNPETLIDHASTMASTSQAVSSPETAAKVVFRQQPNTQIAPHGPPSKPTFVWFYHPANDCFFLTLPAFDCCPPNFGIHYGTAITTCQILACNEDGYLSTSRNRNADGRINIDLDSIIPSEEYYYHLNFPRSEALYPICRDFS